MSVIGVDLGGTRMKIGIATGKEIDALAITESIPEKGLAKCLPLIKKHIRSLLEISQENEIAGIGLAFPGLVNTIDNTVIDTSEKYDDAPGINLVKWAQDEFGLPLKMENDARLACLGEWKYGAGKNTSDMVMCTLGTGIGSSAVINNRILRGKHFQAGVLGGHFIIDYKNTGQRCSCGQFGCVEAAASTRVAKKIDTKQPAFAGSRLKDYDKIDLAIIFELSELGDQLSISIRNDYMQAWSAGLVNLIHAYDPEIVVIGGGIMHSKDILIPYFQKSIAEKAWCPSGIPKILTAEYPDTAAILGAGVLFEDHMLNDKKNYATA